MSRLGGAKRTLCKPCTEVTKLRVWQHSSMSEAMRQSKRQIFAGVSEKDVLRELAIGTRPIDGDKDRLKLAVDRSEGLIDEAIAYDQRLAKRAQWLRRDEGEHCDTALLAEGDDQPFYKRCRNIINDETKAGEPVRIVISTDDNKVPDGAAAAFIATVRIVQQFVPVEVWWQGAWLSDDPKRGFVFHVPLVQGDMDFSRLEFCIADGIRDTFSYHVMGAQAVNVYQEVWNGCGHRAEMSYLPEHGDKARLQNFVAHTGIAPSAQSIASNAAKWIGFEPLWNAEYAEREAQAAALQSLPAEEKPWVDTRTEAQKRRDIEIAEKYWADEKRRREKEASSRLQPV